MPEYTCINKKLHKELFMGKSTLRILLRSVFSAYLLTAIFLLLLAFGLYRFHLTESQITLGVNGIYIISCLIGGIIAGKTARVRRFLWGFAGGCIYFFILLAVSFLIERQIGTDAKELFLIFVMCAGGGTVGGMIS